MLYICPICNLDKNGKKNEVSMENGVPKYKYKWKFKKNACKDCVKIMHESVVLSCNGCDSVTMVDEKMFIKKDINYRNGDVVHIKECPKCSKDKKFTF